MAKPIKETPVLTGRDATKFLKNTSVESIKKVDDSTRERILSNYNKIKGQYNF